MSRTEQVYEIFIAGIVNPILAFIAGAILSFPAIILDTLITLEFAGETGHIFIFSPIVSLAPMLYVGWRISKINNTIPRWITFVISCTLALFPGMLIVAQLSPIIEDGTLLFYFASSLGVAFIILTFYEGHRLRKSKL